MKKKKLFIQLKKPFEAGDLAFTCKEILKHNMGIEKAIVEGYVMLVFFPIVTQYSF